jgi:LPS sulfotransferase NodH
MEQVKRETGFSDFGAEIFMEGYRKLHYSLRFETALHRAGRAEAARVLRLILRNRLLIEDSKTRNPAIAAEQIVRPVFIVGLPRTGSTFLQRLIAADPGWHHLTFEEALSPVASPFAPAEHESNRRKVAEQTLQYRSKFAPGLDADHLTKSDSPEECIYLMQNSFVSVNFHWFGSLSTYVNWLRNVDLRVRNEDYRYQLKLLQHGRKRQRWLLKAPSHSRCLTQILAAFPDACLIVTHREPQAVVSSWINLFNRARNLFSNTKPETQSAVKLHAQNLNESRQCLEKFLADHPHVPTVHVPFKNFTSDPLATAKEIYQAVGQPFTPESEKALQDFLDRDRVERQSRPRPSRSTQTLDFTAIDEIFEGYSAQLKKLEENFPAGS